MRRILLQLDTDPQPSSFDSIVAVDAGAEVLLRYAGVRPESVTPLVHGAIFTRGPSDLKNTAIFIGGSDVALGEEVCRAVTGAFFGPLRVSVLLDSNGANTTACAAVLRVRQHVDLSSARCLVLGGTGPVGRRVAFLLAREGAEVLLGSRSRERAERVWTEIAGRLSHARGKGVETGTAEGLSAALDGVHVVVACGAAGVQLLPRAAWAGREGLRVLVDLNAVPPAGIEGVEPQDKGVEREGVICYGAIGVGGLKMKIHRAAIQKLFEANDLVLDVSEIYELGTALLSAES